MNFNMQKLMNFNTIVDDTNGALMDLGAQLTQDVLLGPDQRLLKPFF